jgi:hypothetical protein
MKHLSESIIHFILHTFGLNTPLLIECFLAYLSRYDDDDDAYLRLQHGKGFHNLAYISYIKHINPASKA